jgi:hypothetical protein
MISLLRRSVGYVIGKLYISYIQRMTTPQYNIYQLRVMLGDVLLKANLTSFQKVMVELATNLEVHNFSGMEWQGKYMDKQFTMVLTVDFNFFFHVCSKKKFPEGFTVKLVDAEHNKKLFSLVSESM